jgi:hypothetical protein
MIAMFWMVYGEGRAAPAFKHFSEQDARREAERLARTAGGKFYVLASVAACERTDVTWEDAHGSIF